MQWFFESSTAFLTASAVAFALLAVGQTVHALLTALRHDAQPYVPAVVYEFCVLVHLMLACSVSVGALYNPGNMVMRFRELAVDLEMVVWIDLAIVVFGAILAIAAKRPVMIPEILVIGLCTPPVVDAAGPLLWVILTADAAFFTFRITTTLVFDKKSSIDNLSRLSLIQAIDLLPEGLMIFDAKGNVLLTNDSMRSCLMSLGLGTEFVEESAIREAFERFAEAGGAEGWEGIEAGGAAGADGELPDAALQEGVSIQISPDEIRLFEFDALMLHGRSCRMVKALDITEEEMLNRRISRMNDLLAAANRDLKASMGRVDRVAKNKAVLNMRSRVHDIIGQRLSILHRFLEADTLDREMLPKVVGLLDSVVDDLVGGAKPGSRAELDSIVEAFALIDVDVHIEGELPCEGDDESEAAIAGVFVKAVREASTNAVRHGRAENVYVQFGEKPDMYVLRVSNDGSPADSHAREGTGLPGVRRTVAEIGGSMRVASAYPFAIEVAVPRPS